MKSSKKRRGFTARDLKEVSDSPEFTKADFAKAKPFAEVFPDLSASIRRGRGPNKAPTKELDHLADGDLVFLHVEHRTRP